MAFSVLNWLLKKKGSDNTQDQGYSNYGYWGTMGNTSPKFWSNPSEQGLGSWGNATPQQPQPSLLDSLSLMPQQGNSLLDILAGLRNNRNMAYWGY